MSNAATVTITVAAPNAPTASNNVYTTPFNTTLTVPASGVLANDNANGGGAMTAVQPSAASSGTAVLNGNGSFTYTPAGGFTGTASFTYRASNSGA